MSSDAQAGAARVLVSDSMSDVGVQIMRDAGLDVDVDTGHTEDELVEMIQNYDALVVRSSTQVTARILEAGDRLKVVGRAGVGVDNVDIEAASRKGVIVMNTPLGNITSAAEHAVALLMAVARNVPQADTAMKEGRWDKKKFTGVELNGKTLGVVGMGKVGQIVTRAAQGLNMSVLAYDPFLPAKRAKELNVTLGELDDVLSKADFVTLHSPLTDATRDLINADALAKMKPSARLVNCARGEIVNDDALIKALEDGTIAAAALDVFDEEPLPEDSPLRKAPNLILTPHLGASTAEAQVKVADAIARQMAAFFNEGKIQHALNLSVALTPELEPFANLAHMLGRVASQMLSSPPEEIKCVIKGKVAASDTQALGVSALQGLLLNWHDQPVNMVNAPLVAEERGLKVSEEKTLESGVYTNLLRLEVKTSKGQHAVAGTLLEGREPRLVELDGFEVEVRPRGHLVLLFYPDRPGMVGKFGTLLGNANINIDGMDVGRKEKGGTACIALNVDDPVSDAVLEELRICTDGGEAYRVKV